MESHIISTGFLIQLSFVFFYRDRMEISRVRFYQVNEQNLQPYWGKIRHGLLYLHFYKKKAFEMYQFLVIHSSYRRHLLKQKWKTLYCEKVLRTSQRQRINTLYQIMDHWPWMPELRGIFLSLICEEIFKNGNNII